MATAHLIHGFLGVGKTTFARRLERELPAVRYSHDEWMARLYGIDPPVERFAAYRDAVSDVMNAHWPRVLACGADVILDFGFWTRASRDEARAGAAKVGAHVRLYCLECPETIARSRCRARNANLDGSLHITDNTYDVLRARFQPLQADESCERIETNLTEETS
jgi:predicted kinase